MIARISFRSFATPLAAMALVASLAGCASGKWGFPYKAPIQQGNWITQEQVALLQVGMTREQVRFALGSPTLTSALRADRWDYPYYFKPGYGTVQERKFTVWFENDRLVRWSGDEQPDLQPFQIHTPDAAADVKADEREAVDEAREATDGGKQVDKEIDLTTPDSPLNDYPGEPGDATEPLR